jgi:hypothetical protein
MFEKNRDVMNPTLELMKVIGSPFAAEEPQESLQEKEISDLYLHAIKNRMPLLYLDNLEKRGRLSGLKSVYLKQYSRYLKILDTMVKVSDFLNGLGVRHAIFKSIRPYPDASVDIDTLIFDSEKYGIAVKSFLKGGWRMLGFGPQSTTFFDTEAEVGIDLYRDVAVSWVIYIDKKKLERSAISVELPNNQHASSLAPEADLTAIIAHSVIKEQVYTLAEFYTFMKLVEKMSVKEVESLAQSIKLNNLVAVANAFLSITLALHDAAFDFIPEKLAILSRKLGVNALEQRKLVMNNFDTPHKYHFLTLIRCFTEKLKDEKTRKTVALQAFEMANPRFTKTVFTGFLDHVKRETY